MMLRKVNMSCNIIEKKDEFILELDLPGYDKEDMKIYVENGYLNVVAKKDKERNKEEYKYIRRERYHGEISRSFYLGKNVKEEDISASYKHGILKIQLPKMDAKEIEEKGRISIA